MLGRHWQTRKSGSRNGDSVFNVTGAGWEAVLEAPFEREAERMIAQANDKRFAIPAEIGRYEVVMDGAAVAKLADVQIGAATELDRAMTYLANTAGTSYINQPLDMVGTYQLGAPLLTVTANRTRPGHAATVQWDDEGVVPDEATIIKNGVLSDFQTTRESARWLESYYQKNRMPVRSHGGATRGMRAWVEPEQGPHNLEITPATQNTSFDALCSGIKRGLAVLSGQVTVDQQMLNAELIGDVVYEIRNGKLGRAVEGGTFLFRAPEFWKSLTTLGGKQTVCNLGLGRSRSGYASDYEGYHTVSAPAAVFKDATLVIDRPAVLA